MRTVTKRTLSVAIAATVVLGAAGVAYAYWTTTGTGSGTATTGTNVPVTVNQAATTEMFPGDPAQTLSGTFDNTNAGPAYVTAVTATGYTIDAPHVAAGCIVADGNYTLGGTAAVGADVPAGLGVGAWTGLTLTMNNLGTNQDFCKGATLTITYASS